MKNRRVFRRTSITGCYLEDGVDAQMKGTWWPDGWEPIKVAKSEAEKHPDEDIYIADYGKYSRYDREADALIPIKDGGKFL